MAKDFMDLLHTISYDRREKIDAEVEDRFYKGIEEPPAEYSEDEKDYYMQWLEAVKEKDNERCMRALYQTVMMRLDEGKKGPPNELDKKWHDQYMRIEQEIEGNMKAGRVVNYSFSNNYD